MSFNAQKARDAGEGKRRGPEREGARESTKRYSPLAAFWPAKRP